MRSELNRAKDKRLWKKIAKAALVGNMVTLILLAVCAVAIWKGAIPESVAGDLALGAAFAGAIVSGAVTAAGEGSAVLPGLLGGLGFLILVIVAGLYREQFDFFDTTFLKTAICALAGGTFGGIISTSKKNKKRSFRNKRYTASNH